MDDVVGFIVGKVTAIFVFNNIECTVAQIDGLLVYVVGMLLVITFRDVWQNVDRLVGHCVVGNVENNGGSNDVNFAREIQLDMMYL